MRQPTIDQEMIALRDHLARILAAGCPETTRLSEHAWTLVHQALATVTRAPAEVSAPPPPASIKPALDRAA